jgi:nitroreductase
MPNAKEHLEWRYATKHYDTTKKLTDEQRSVITEALRLAPSSYGLQPWKFVHVTNPETRERLKEAAWNQAQLTEASDIFVLCSVNVIDEAYIDRYLASTAKARSMDVAHLAGFKELLMNTVKGMTPERMEEWNARQVYIALGVAMQAAAEHRIDTSPMEGFNGQAFDEILGLGVLGLKSRLILAAGFRSSDDAVQNYAKSRFDADDVFIQR